MNDGCLMITMGEAIAGLSTRQAFWDETGVFVMTDGQ